MIGASGAIMAVVVIYALHYPHREVLLFFVLPVEMWLLVIIFLGYGRLAVVARRIGPGGGGVALDGGGLRLPLQTVRPTMVAAPVVERVGRPRLRIVTPEPREKITPHPAGPSWTPSPSATPKPSATAVIPEEQLDAKLDEVLAKIAREGRAGLTEEENRVLDEASRRARNRRSDRF